MPGAAESPAGDIQKLGVGAYRKCIGRLSQGKLDVALRVPVDGSSVKLKSSEVKLGGFTMVAME